MMKNIMHIRKSLDNTKIMFMTKCPYTKIDRRSPWNKNKFDN